MKRLKHAIAFTFMLLTVYADAQLKIGDSPATINANSLLELESTDKGFVPPRLAITDVTTPAPLVVGLLAGTVVYNTNSPATTGGSGAGLYVWNGVAWEKLSTGSASSGWLLTGNPTATSTDFIGPTTVGVPMVVKSGITTVGKFHPNLIALGNNAGGTISGNSNIAIGNSAYTNSVGGGGGNIAIGNNAMYTTSTNPFNNVAVGGDALYSLTNGTRNVAIGFEALRLNSNAVDNTAIGHNALKNVSTGPQNTAVGSFAMAGNTATGSTGVGYAALQGTGGNDNVAMGYFALQNMSGASNVALGRNAGAARNSYTGCTFVGWFSDAGSAGLTNATAIGYNSRVGISNALVLGAVGTNVGINTISPNSYLQVNGAVSYAINVRSGAYVVTGSDNIILAAAASTITLPAPSGITGRMYTIKATGATVTITPASGTIEGAASYTLISIYDFITVVSTGTEWLIISK